MTNVAPTLSISGAASVNAATLYTLNLTHADVGADTISKWTINWGDGTAAQDVTGNPSSVTHTYAAGPNNYTISATATDEDGTYTVGNTVAVAVATAVDGPTLGITGPANATEGSSYTLTLASSGTGASTISKWTINWGDGTAAQDVTGNPGSVTHTYADGPNAFTISATATNPDGTFAVGNTVPVTVNNVTPTLSISGAASVNAGALYTLNLTHADVGADTISKWNINWGDGTAVQEVTGNPTSATHTYAAGPNNYTISATATDEDGTHTAGNTVAVAVAAAAAAPTLGIIGPATATEGSSYTLTLASSGAGASTISKWTINWGDGTAAQDVTGNPGSVTHTYADGPNAFTISATATNPDGTFSAVNTVAVSVTNVVPTLAISGAATVNQGSLYTLTLTRSDVGADTISKWTINWGDGTAAQDVTGNPSSVTHTYAAGPNNYTISATATDEDGTHTVGNTVAVAVSNGTTSFAINGSATVNEGATYSLALSSQNAGTISKWTINWGDGTAAQDVTGNPTSVTHVYADGPNAYTISATATNENGTFAAGNNIAVTVANIVPTVSFTGSSIVNEGTVDSWALASTDVGTETVTQYVIHWGDGNDTTITPAQLSAADGSVQHTYADGGNEYTITVDVTDEDGTYLARATRSVTVNNVQPFLNVTGPSSVAVDASNDWTLGNVIDPGSDTVTLYIVRWGDGNTSTFTPAELADVSRVITHTYASADTYTLAIDLVDEDGTFMEAGGLLVTVTA